MRPPPRPPVSIAVFYHVAQIGPAWQAIDSEIMGALRSSGLLASAGTFVRNECSRAEDYEFPTIRALHAFAKANDSAYVYLLYLHTKGVTQLRPSIDDWRACMLYWNVMRWQDCVGKLAAGHDAVGVSVIDTPRKHFQGNFWWAKATLVARLGPVENVEFVPTHTNQNERHKAEFWVLSNGGKVYSPYHHKVNPYIDRNPARNYIGRRF